MLKFLGQMLAAFLVGCVIAILFTSFVGGMILIGILVAIVVGTEIVRSIQHRDSVFF